jgi:hypothetical protein
MRIFGFIALLSLCGFLTACQTESGGYGSGSYSSSSYTPPPDNSFQRWQAENDLFHDNQINDRHFAN